MTEPIMIIVIARVKTTQNYQDALKLINARIANLESNLHIEIDMERIEDRSKALSFIGIEVADALKVIPAPAEEKVQEKVSKTEQIATAEETREEQYVAETFETKLTFWEKIKQSKIARAIKSVLNIRIVVDNSNALPEGKSEN